MNKNKDILKQPRKSRVRNVLILNPSFNIRRDKAKTVNSMICTFTLCVLHIMYQMKKFTVNNVLHKKSIKYLQKKLKVRNYEP